MTTPAPPTDPPRCAFVKADGSRCRVTFGLHDGLCSPHDPARKAATDAARAAGGTTTSQVRRASKYRVLDPQQLGGRPARTLADIERGVATMTFAVGTGAADPATAREYFRGATTHREIKTLRRVVADLLSLRRDLKALKRGRSA